MKCEHRHVTKTGSGCTEPAWMATCRDCGAPLGQKDGEYYLLPEHGPQPGTYAYTAFIMAQLEPPSENDLPDDFWDNWKENMKGN